MDKKAITAGSRIRERTWNWKRGQYVYSSGVYTVLEVHSNLIIANDNGCKVELLPKDCMLVNK